MAKKVSKKRYTAKALRRACDAYYASISYKAPAMREEIVLKEDGSPELDYYGHPKRRYVQIVTSDGQAAEITKWTEQPSVAGLCIWLGINRSTLMRYGTYDPDRPQSAELCEIVQAAKARIEAYLSQKLEEKGAANGTKFSLSHNFGWGKDDQEEKNVEFKVHFNGKFDGDEKGDAFA